MRLHVAFVAIAIAATLSPRSAAQSVTVTGAGSTFAAPLYQRWSSEFQKTHPSVQVAYRGGGSAAGIHLGGADAAPCPGNDAEVTMLRDRKRVTAIAVTWERSGDGIPTALSFNAK